MYNAVDVASYIVGRCANLGRPVTNLQLQKILYYVQLNFLRRFDEFDFWDDIQEQRDGKAVKEVYYKYNIWGRHEIVPRAVQAAKETFSEKDRELVDRVTDACLLLDPWELEERSQKAGGLWHQSFDGNLEKVIPKEVMREYVREHRTKII